MRYFLAVAEEGTITKAAEVLNITQPTLSRQLAELEDELGVRLFERGRGRIALTEEGRFLRQRAEELLALAQLTEEGLASHRGALSGQIALACTETRGADCLFSLVHSFRAEHPAVRFAVHSANVDSIRERLDKGLADFGLLTEPADTKDYERLELPVKDRWGAIVSSGSALAKLDAIKAADLEDGTLILPERREVWPLLERWLGHRIREESIAATVNLGRNASVLVAQGVGTALGLDLPDSSDTVVFIPLEPPLETGSALCWKARRISSPAAAAFLEHIRKALS